MQLSAVSCALLVPCTAVLFFFCFLAPASFLISCFLLFPTTFPISLRQFYVQLINCFNSLLHLGSIESRPPPSILPDQSNLEIPAKMAASTTQYLRTSMSNTTGPLMITNHPYYPLDVEIASYLANEYSVPFLLGVFFSLCAGIVAFTRGWVRNFHPGLPGREKAAIWWFVICMSTLPPNFLDV